MDASRTVLVLGGTTEGRAAAAALAVRPGLRVVSSLAGAVRSPSLPDGEVRVGGFGGVAGLVVYLRDERIDAVLDATHPFAGGMTANAAAACSATGVPLIVLRRPGWTAGPGDRWIRVRTVGDAAAALPGLLPGSGGRDGRSAAGSGSAGDGRTGDPALPRSPGAPGGPGPAGPGSARDRADLGSAGDRAGTRSAPDRVRSVSAASARVLLTTGRGGLSAFAGVDAAFWIRAVDPPPPPLPVRHTLLLDRGPFTLDAERALLAEIRPHVLVTKDSGGTATAPKLTAAREAGIPVLVVDRPPLPDGVATASTVEEALTRLGLLPA